MHTGYPGFKENPFKLDLELKFLYKSLNGESVYRQISEDIRKGLGIILLIGENGTGKTLVLHELTHRLQSEVKFIQRHAASNSFEDLVNGLCDDLGLGTANKTTLDKIQSLDDYLSEAKQTNPRIALIIDDAHQLQDDVLSKVVLLSLPPSNESASLQIVLSGLPELEVKVEKCKLPPHEQFMVFCHRLECLDPSEVGAFIKQHLDVGDDGYGDLFTPAAISRIADYSKGIPRLIKKICGSALSAISAQDSPSVTEELVDRAAKDWLLVPSETASPTVTAKLDDSNSLESKNVAFTATEDTLSLAESDVRKNVDAIENRQPTTRDSLNQAMNVVNEQSPSSLGEAAENTNTDDGEGGSQPLMNKTSTQRLAWGIAALIIFGGVIIAYQSNISPLPNNSPTANLEAEFSDQAALLLDDSGRPDQTGPTFDKRLTQFSKGRPEFEQLSTESLTASTDKPGSAARAFITDLENSSQPVSLDTVYGHAELLSKQNQSDDVYLLYFYAAKRGHGNAAFRLAQMADPATFANDGTVLEKPSVMQANKWYLQAVEAGHPKAEHHLTRLRARVITKANAGDDEAQRLLMQFQKNKKSL